jgi:predicted ester cyclase
MSTEGNKAIARRILEEVWNKGNLKVLDEFVAPGAPSHDPNNVIAPGPEGLKQIASLYRSAMPDLRFTIEQELTDGDYVVQRVTATGTQKGDLPGIPATGKRATVTGVIVTRLKDGKVVEGWSQFDQLGLLQQLGVIPMPEQMAPTRR